MNNHLSDDQIAEWALGAKDEIVLRHLETCHECSREAEQLRCALGGFRDSIHTAARRHQSFWRNQQLAIRGRSSGWYPLDWAWAAAMVLVLITALFLMRAPNSIRKSAGDDADNALLEQVQGDLAREVPEALAPAALIAEERNEILTNKGVQQTEVTPKRRR